MIYSNYPQALYPVSLLLLLIVVLEGTAKVPHQPIWNRGETIDHNESIIEIVVN